MVRRCLLVVLGVGLGLAVALPSPAAENKTDGGHIAKLIDQLGSPKFAEREDAMKELEKIGVPALPALRKATKSNDAETRRRAEELVGKLSKLEETAKVLTPTTVRLVYKDTPVADAVADIAKKTGFQITLVGDTAKLADRKVTLDTGETTFWQALDQFCEKAGLVETGVAGRSIPVDERPRPLPAGRRAPAQPAPAKPAANAPVQPQAKVEVKEAKAEVKEVTVEVKANAAVAVAQVQAVPPPAPGGAAAPVQFARVIRPGYRPYSTNQIMLMDGKADKLPTCYSGAVRIQALRPNTPAAASVTREGEKLLILEASPEPKLQWQYAQGVRIEKAIDDNGQQLAQSMAVAQDQGGVEEIQIINGGGGRQVIAFNKVMADRAVYFGGQRQVPVRLKAGDKPSKKLKELTGTISAQVRTAPQALLVVEQVMKATGKTIKGKEGGSIKVIDAKREDDQIKLQLEMEMPPNVMAASGAVEDFGMGMVMPVRAIQVLPAQAAPPPPAVVPPAPAAPPAEAPPAPAPKKGAQAPAAPAGKAKAEVAAAAPAPAPAAGQAVPPPQAAPAQAGAVFVNARRAVYANFNGLSLLDEKGQGYQLVGVNSQGRANGKTIVYEYTLTYKLAKGQGDPAKLIFSGQRLVTVDIPFTLKDVPLP